MQEEDWEFLSQYGVTPDNLTVKRSLYLGGTDVTVLPDNLTVEGDLDLSCTAITELPDRLTVKGHLDLNGTAVTKLPNTFTVWSDLCLKDAAITELPDALTVGGNLDLEGTAITELPDALTVYLNLNLNGTAVTKLPDPLAVGGTLGLKRTAITKLPEPLTVRSHLDLRDTAIAELPDALTVRGYLDLRDTAITKLPDTLIVGGCLYLRGTTITELPDTLQCGQIYMDDDGPLDWRGDRLTIQNIDDMTMVIGPWKRRDGVEVCRARYLQGCDLADMPGCYIARDNEHTAHGKTLREAIEDLRFKILVDASDRDELVPQIRARGTLTIAEYRVLTGACREGIRQFLDARNIPPEQESMPLAEVLEITKGAYGGARMQELFGAPQ